VNTLLLAPQYAVYRASVMSHRFLAVCAVAADLSERCEHRPDIVLMNSHVRADVTCLERPFIDVAIQFRFALTCDDYRTKGGSVRPLSSSIAQCTGQPNRNHSEWGCRMSARICWS
jgi:hypothetical protein